MDLQTKILFTWICLQVILASVFSDVWKAEVPQTIHALVSSCVVLPCKFNYPADQYPDSLVKGIWHKTGDRKHRIYDEDRHNVVDNFKSRTTLVGRLGQKNCTLEINEVKDHDIGPFCFRAEIKDFAMFSFEEACVRIHMIPEPEKPSLDYEESVKEGLPALFKCSVRHTCPTHHPTIKWSRSDFKPRVIYKLIGNGVWEVESFLTFTPTQEDDHKEINCTVTYYNPHGQPTLTSQATHKIYVKRKENYFHIIIPVAAVFGTILLFGTACFFVIKRYKKQIQDLQTRNPDGVWSRLSRMSHRVRNHVRRQEPDRNIGTKSNNYPSTQSGTAGFSKPRCPSPQSEKKGYNKSGGRCSDGYDEDDYTNVGDLNVYGNI